MSGDILTTIIAVLTIFGFMSAQTVMISRGQNQLREEFSKNFENIHEELKEFRGEVHEEFKEVRADIAAVNERLSHTDGLVEGLSRALLKTNVA